MKFWIGMLALGLPLAAAAETLYVSERLTVAVLATPAEGAPIRTVEAGSAVEVLEKTERFTRIRDRQGMEGWVDSRYLVAELPARARLQRAAEESAALRRELTEAQAKLKKAEAEAAQQLARSEALAKELANAGGSAPPVPVVAATPPPSAGKSVTPVEVRTASVWAMDFSLSWALLSFAMLVSGFAGGVVWLRESIRRRSGGMYLRV